MEAKKDLPSTDFNKDDSSVVIGKDKPITFINRLIPKRFINIYSYTALLSIVQFWYSFYLAYTIAALTTLERRYGMPSLYSGLFLACFEIGHLTIIIFSFTETNCHIPRRLAIRGFFMSIGALLMASPHVLVPVSSDINRRQHLLMMADIDQSNTTLLQCFDPGQRKALRNCTAEELGDELTLVTKSAGEAVWALVILTMAQCIVATASSTYCVIGVLYIDNNLDKERSSAFIGTVYSMMMLGPAGAFFFSSGVASSLYVHPFDPNPPDTSSSAFVGAWWAGFILSSLMFLAISPLFLLFPMKLEQKESRPSEPHSKSAIFGLSLTDALNCDGSSTASKVLLSKDASLTASSAISISPENDVDSEPFTVKTIPKNFAILFRNTMFLALVFLACAQFYITAGYFTFFPKYIEAQFKQPVWVANLVSGITIPFPCCIGTFLGGLLMSKLKLSQSNALMGAFILSTIVAVGLLFISDLHCESERIIGLDLNQQYDRQPPSAFFSVGNEEKCRNRCDFCPQTFNPVCGNDGSTYASPCHAGCLFFNAKNQTYSHCGCVGDLSNSTTGGTAVPEKCRPVRFLDRFCKSFFVYVTCAFLLAVLIILPSTPLLICMMRCVGPRYKSWAIGLTSSFCSFLSFIPAPVIYGSLFDSHCRFWDEQSTLLGNPNYQMCDSSQFISKDEVNISSLEVELLIDTPASPRNCILYETKSLSAWFHVLTSSFLFISLPVNVYAWWKSRENERKLNGSSVTERFSSIRAVSEERITVATEI